MSLRRRPERTPPVDQITLLVGPQGHETLSTKAFGARFGPARAGRGPAFQPERMTLISRFADQLSRDKRFQDWAAMRAFAFWIRKGAVESMRRRFEGALPEGVVAMGRGLAFHLPPANVDTIFLYSWVCAFLTGNVSMTRLPSAPGPLTEAALRLLIALLAEGGWQDVFISYPPSDAVSGALSALSDLRLVWGGDEKAATFARLPVRLDGRTITFPDRYSYSVLDGAHLASLDAAETAALARRLFNDVFVFGQMACSSPHVLHVVGTGEAHASAVRTLLEAVDALARAQDLVDPAVGVEKFTAVSRMAAEGAVDQVERFSVELTAARLSEAARPAVGGGLLGVRYIDRLDDLVVEVEERDQTLGYEGFSREVMAQFVRAAGRRGLCRVVPIGQALDFDTIWDGADLLRDGVRLVRVL